MRKYLILFPLLLWCLTACAGKKQPKDYVIGFYNVENLFDIYDNTHANDEEFLPEGANQWDITKYRKKQSNIADAIKAMADANGRFHTVLGLAEVENETVLKDLVSQPQIAAAKYRYVHFEGPDPRGIDVAFLYKPDEFTLIDSERIPFSFEGSPVNTKYSESEKKTFRTRDILMMHGKIEGEEFAFYVAHLPSRIGGKGVDTRCLGADIIYRHSRRMAELHPGIKIVVMGDMNDDPTDESQTVWLHGRETVEEMTEADFFSPFTRMLKEGFGSLEYKGVWNIFDIIQVNYNLAKAPKGKLHIKANSQGYYGNIFKADFLTQQSGRYKGTPFRTFSGGKFIGGYSDHYPTFIIIGK